MQKPAEWLKVFLPNGDEVTWTGNTSVGTIAGKTFSSDEVAVAARSEDAKWKLEIPAANIAEFQRDIGDIFMLCRYRVGSR